MLIMLLALAIYTENCMSFINVYKLLVSFHYCQLSKLLTILYSPNNCFSSITVWIIILMFFVLTFPDGKKWILKFCDQSTFSWQHPVTLTKESL